MCPNRYGLRFAVMGLVATLCSMTFATTAPTYFDSGGATATTTMSPFDNVIVISLAADHQPAFDIMPIIKHDRVASDYPAFRPMAIKECASRFAVRPTALSGWRSGRVRTLAV